MKTLLKIVAFTALLLGIRLYQCSSFRDEYKTTSLEKCGEQQRCIDLVENSDWDKCFDVAYKMGRHSSFDEGRFHGCLANSQRH
ncbi:MAG: hypothetical protein EOP10_06820 [Proteobacteria bacterium]|nr:MAG: hypothetical protein EOP10_06820 [Pseudomonadota bacterium]